MLADARLPPPLIEDARCRECSLIDICQPKAVTLMRMWRHDDLFDPDR
jgi:CRISPR-associated exonuclease Cas4